jgi:hypothetical protein
MVVRLQTADGKINEYQTVYGVGNPIGGEVSGYEKWITKCGREWDKEPEPDQECDHLMCAIHNAEHWELHRMMSGIFTAFAIIIFGIAQLFRYGPPISLLVLSMTFVFLAILIWICSHEEKGRWDELNEFKNNGTIKGIIASQISDNT